MVPPTGTGDLTLVYNTAVNQVVQVEFDHAIEEAEKTLEILGGHLDKVKQMATAWRLSRMEFT